MFGMLAEANREAAELWRKGAETMLAAAFVVAKRSNLMAQSAGNPATTDLVELGRMVPEKMAAFGLANLALVEALWAMQTGSAASLAGTLDKALTPIHARATANARRLSRRRR